MSAGACPSSVASPSSSSSLLVSHLTRLQQQQAAWQQADAASTTTAKDGQVHLLRRQQQSEALRTVLQFLCANASQEHSDAAAATPATAAVELMEAAWQATQPKVASLMAAYAEQMAKKAGAHGSGSGGQRLTRAEKRAGGGGAIPAQQQEQLTLQRERIQSEQLLWIYLEAVRLLAQMIAEQRVPLSAVATATAELIVAAAAQLLAPAFLQSHEIAVHLLRDTASLAPTIRRRVQDWCLSALEATCTSSVAPSSATPPDARPVCALAALLVRSPAEDAEPATFDAAVWKAACTVLQSAPSVYARQSVLRELLPLSLQAHASANERAHQLLAILTAAWTRAIDALRSRPKAKSSVSYMHGVVTRVDASAIASSPLLSSEYLQELQAVRPQLDLLFDILCAHYDDLFAGLAANQHDRRDFDVWLLDTILCGLASGVTVAKKQCTYLLQRRQQLRQCHCFESFALVDYTPVQWSAFHHLFSLFGSAAASLHLMEQGFPRIQLLLESDAPKGMSRFLELLMWKIFAHPHPSMSTLAFQQLHAFCFPDASAALSDGGGASIDANSSAAAGVVGVPRSYALTPSMVFGPILAFFDDPSLFSPDKQRRGTHRVGDQLLESFLLEYMRRLPLTDAAASADGAPCTRPEFLRFFLHAMCHPPAISSVISLAVQLSALAHLEATHCLTEADVQLLWLMTHHRVQEASSRLRMELTVYTLQIFCRHTNFATAARRPDGDDGDSTSSSFDPLSFAMVGRMLAEWPIEWMRPNGASFQLLLTSLNGAPDGEGEGWLAKNIRPAIDRHFDLITAGGAASADDLHASASTLSQLLLFVPDASALESTVLAQLRAKVEGVDTGIEFASNSSASSSSSSSSPQPDVDLSKLLGVFDFLSTYFNNLNESRARHLRAHRESDLEWLETVCIPNSASSHAYVDPTASARIAETEWRAPMHLLTTAITQYGLASVDAIVRACQQPTSSSSSRTVAPDSIPASLPNVLSSLLAHASLASLRRRLLAIVWQRVSDAQAWSRTSQVSPTEGFTLCALVHAIVINCVAEDFTAAAAAAESTAHGTPAASSTPTTSPSPLLPLSLIPSLVSCLIQAHQPGKPPAASHLSNDDWKRELQLFHQRRWHAAQKLLELDARQASVSLIDVCIDSLDGATEFFIESIFHCIRFLLPAALAHQLEVGGPSRQLAFLDAMYSAGWNAFRDLHLQLASPAPTLAFLAMMFETTAFRLAANHRAVDGPCAKYFRILVEYGARHTRFLVYVAFFATAGWLRYPSLLPHYVDDLLAFTIFLADSSLEVDLIEEKLSAYALAHLIHNYSDVSKVDKVVEEDAATSASPSSAAAAEGEDRLIGSTQLRRAESLIRCIALHFLQLLPKRMADFAADSPERVAVASFLFSFSHSVLHHPQMVSDRGCVAGEGNVDFVGKCHLFQTACFLVPMMHLLEEGSEPRERLHRQLQEHAWAWHQRPIASVLRHYVESFLSLLYTIAPQRIDLELVPHLAADANRPTLLASLILVLAQATMSIASAEVRQAQARRTILLLHPFCACNFGHVRLVAQYLYHRLMRDLAPSEWKEEPVQEAPAMTSSVGSSSSVDGACVRSLMHYLSSDADMARLRDRQDAYFAHFNPRAASTVEGILCGTGEHHYFMPKPLMEQMTQAQGAYLSRLRDAYDDRKFAINGPTDGDEPPQSAAATASDPSSASSSESAASSGSHNYQQKIDVMPLQQLTALGDFAGGAAAAELDANDESASVGPGVSLRDAVTHRTSQGVHQRVIVIASLVSKLPNLAGLSRTCEIFGAESLLVADKTVVHDRDFKSVSVTAHKWLQIDELRPEGIRDFMALKKAAGYTCIALEQSAASIRLPAFQFPARVVLLLGAEKEGVPIELLNLVDHSVEIPQLGIIRSLNVHVSGSILLWEYTRQQLLGLAAPA